VAEINASSEPVQLIPVNVCGTEVLAHPHQSDYLASLKRCCQGLGVSYSAQLKKLKTAGWNPTVAMIATVGQDGNVREMVMIDRRTLVMWLSGINSKKVRPAIRAKLEKFQAECADVLDRHFGYRPQPQPSEAPTTPATLHPDIAALLVVSARHQAVLAGMGLVVDETRTGLARVDDRVTQIDTAIQRFESRLAQVENNQSAGDVLSSVMHALTTLSNSNRKLQKQVADQKVTARTSLATEQHHLEQITDLRLRLNEAERRLAAVIPPVPQEKEEESASSRPDDWNYMTLRRYAHIEGLVMLKDGISSLSKNGKRLTKLCDFSDIDVGVGYDGRDEVNTYPIFALRWYARRFRLGLETGREGNADINLVRIPTPAPPSGFGSGAVTETSGA